MTRVLVTEQRGKTVLDAAADSRVASEEALETISRHAAFAEVVRRRRVRSDSVARFLEVTALTPAPDWRHDELKGLLSHTSEEVRGG